MAPFPFATLKTFVMTAKLFFQFPFDWFFSEDRFQKITNSKITTPNPSE
jgi:hypothetical protein